MREVPPLRVTHGEWYSVVHDSHGRIVAQGSPEMCERRGAGWSGLAQQGDLFDAQRIARV